MKSIKKFFKLKIYLWLVLAIGITVLASFAYGYTKGIFGQDSVTESSQVTKYLEKTDEHVFLNVGIQHVETQKNNSKIPWTDFKLPFSEKKAIIILNYEAKLGIQEPVTISENGEKSYTIKVPQFSVIGIDLDKENPYQLYDKEGDLLSMTTKDVDTGKLATQALSKKKQEKYLSQYTSYLKESATDYYQNLFKAIDPEIQIEVVFAN
ncbi:DUF4230 domain-containing protein [Streptococcus cameli]